MLSRSPISFHRSAFTCTGPVDVSFFTDDVSVIDSHVPQATRANIIRVEPDYGPDVGHRLQSFGLLSSCRITRFFSLCTVELNDTGQSQATWRQVELRSDQNAAFCLDLSFWCSVLRPPSPGDSGVFEFSQDYPF